jgi:type II secretory pathway component GspD/PulD (secretin)
LISATAKVNGNAIVVELEVEKSQLERRGNDSQPSDQFVPSVTETLTSRVTLRIGSGRTVLASGIDKRAEATTSSQLVLVSARLLEPSSETKDVATTNGAKKVQTRIFSLQNLSARDAAPLIREIFDKAGQTRVGVESRTNSLIVSAEKENLDVVEAILLRLDESDPRRIPQAPKDRKKSDAASGVTKYDKMEKLDLQRELKRLQKELLDSERTANQAREKTAEAAEVHKSALGDEKAEALLRMIEADAESRKSIKSYMQIRSDFDAAQRAYLRLLVAE